MRCVAFLAVIFVAVACGTERWSVKVGTDSDAYEVNLNYQDFTKISYLANLPQPSTLPDSSRIKPTETTQWVLNCTLVKYKLEADEDYHLVLEDSNGNTMIGEIPNPSCAPSGPFQSGITNARNEFDSQFSVTDRFQNYGGQVQIMGIGFFDFIHGQAGVAPNGIEIHPVLDIQFL